MKENVMIPEDRIGVIKSKKTKAEIEEKLGVKLIFFENSVEIDGEGVDALKAKVIAKAIARGFSPLHAFELMKDGVQLEIIDLGSLSDNKIGRIKSRVIGANGKTRVYIESSTKCFISVYGKTVSIIGTYEDIRNAKEAVEMIIGGMNHSSVYKFLDKVRSETKESF